MPQCVPQHVADRRADAVLVQLLVQVEARREHAQHLVHARVRVKVRVRVRVRVRARDRVRVSPNPDPDPNPNQEHLVDALARPADLQPAVCLGHARKAHQPHRVEGDLVRLRLRVRVRVRVRGRVRFSP